MACFGKCFMLLFLHDDILAEFPIIGLTMFFVFVYQIYFFGQGGSFAKNNQTPQWRPKLLFGAIARVDHSPRVAAQWPKVSNRHAARMGQQEMCTFSPVKMFLKRGLLNWLSQNVANQNDIFKNYHQLLLIYLKIHQD